jgi:glycosyltransferase involved in cell wall biosynthesis
VPLGVPISRIAAAPERDIAALAYAGNPHKRGLEVLCAAWAESGLPGRLVIGGIAPSDGRAWIARHGVPEPAGVEWAGVVPRAEWHALLGRASLYVNASRFEDHGIAPLEALSAGAALVSLPTPGPYPALRMARELAPELVSADLAGALRAGASVRDRADYARRADELLAPHRVEALRDVMARQVLPALNVGSR